MNAGLLSRRSPISESNFLSALNGKRRLLPAIIKQRRLNPSINGDKDKFRSGEIHLTSRDDTHPMLLELLCNMGFSAPSILKLMELQGGTLARDLSGSPFSFHDYPLTLQFTSMSKALLAANFVTSIVKDVGGVKRGSIKVEFATDLLVCNGVDCYRHVPPVVETFTQGAHIDLIVSRRTVEATGKSFREHVHQAKNKALTTPHWDRISAFN